MILWQELTFNLPFFYKNKNGALKDHLPVCPLNPVARQGLVKHVPAATNTHTGTEGLLEAMLSMLSLTYQLLNM
jgi:hypothetical protein